ncbi:MAG: hypothetical protein AB7K36_12760 [Chloroflexota bacterium]
MPQHVDPSFWALLTGLPLLGLFVLALFLRRRHLERREGLAGPRPTAVESPGSAAANAAGVPRRQPVVVPPPTGAQELASAARSAILRAVAERSPAGWTTLVLCPPPHATRMTWHVHLAPAVALDLPDGRSVPTGPPTPSHEWQLPGGRSVGVGNGDPDPAPVEDTLAVRISGPYLQVNVLTDEAGAPRLTARVEGSPDGSPELRAPLSDVKAMQAALREGVEQAIGTRMLGTPPTLGYRPGAWHGHDRVWLTVGR